MKKKYFTEEEKREARKLEAKKYYDKFRKLPIAKEEKERRQEESKRKRKEYAKEYYKKNKDKILNYSKQYFKNNQKLKQTKNNERYKSRKEESPLFKLSCNIRRSIRAIIKKKGFLKSSTTVEILGCDFETLKQHIEARFQVWMNWSNHGKYNGEPNYGWDIDHIIPLSSAVTDKELIMLNHYSNLQPLCSYINRVVKRDNIITVQKENNISKITLK